MKPVTSAISQSVVPVSTADASCTTSRLAVRDADRPTLSRGVAHPPAPLIHVVVVTYNSEPYISGCLHSLRGELPDGALTVTIVDNGSSDGTVSRARRDVPDAEIIQARANLGFARGVNIGASRRAAAARWLLLLNPDVRIDTGSLRSLVATAERVPAAGIYGGQARDERGALHGTCLAAPSLRQAITWATGVRRLPLLSWLDPDVVRGPTRDGVRPVPALAGSLLLIDARLWERLGGFDEAFVQYGEDVDLCRRARCQGASPLYCAESRYIHLGGTSITTTERAALVLRGKAELYRRYLPTARAALAVSALKVGVVARAAFRPTRATDWNVVWAARAEWANGFHEGCEPRVAVGPRRVGRKPLKFSKRRPRTPV
jgi:N-acetylglucosaminyl-diphospho-decaprenol L-rhamnosyltransferase